MLLVKVLIRAVESLANTGLKNLLNILCVHLSTHVSWLRAPSFLSCHLRNLMVTLLYSLSLTLVWMEKGVSKCVNQDGFRTP